MNEIPLLVLFVVLISGGLMFLFYRRQARRPVSLRPLAGYEALANQVGRAVESGRQLHFTLGRARLDEAASPASLAAVTALDYLARNACASGVPPAVTVGEGTLLAAAQDSLRHAYQSVGRLPEFDPASAQFLADARFPFVYAAGVNSTIHQEKVAGNILLGRYGLEAGIMAEAGTRSNVEPIMGSDDPEGLAVGAAVTQNLLVGEELLAAGAYLEGKRSQLASLQAQDALRYLVIAGILLSALLALLGGSG